MEGRTGKGEKLELLTTGLDLNVLVGEAVRRTFFFKEIPVNEEPAWKGGRPYPLGDVAAWIVHLDARIDEKDRVLVQGRAAGKTMFFGVHGPKEIFLEEEDFRLGLEIPGVLPGMQVHVHGRVTYSFEDGAPLQSEAQVLYRLKVELEILVAVTDPQQLEVAVGVKDLPAERVTRDLLVMEELLAEQAESISLSREVEFEEELSYLKVLSCRLRYISWEQNKEHLLVKGELETVLFYLAGEKSGLLKETQPFNQQVAFQVPRKEAHLAVFPRVEYAACDLLGRRARQRTYLDLLIRAVRTVQQEVVTAVQGMAVKKEYLAVSRPAAAGKENVELVQRLAFPYPDEITAGGCRLLSLDFQLQEDAVLVEGTLEKNVYYLPRPERGTENDEPVELWPLTATVEEEFSRTMQLPGISPQACAAVYFNMGTTDFAPAEAATLQVSHAALEIKTWEMQEHQVVVPHRVPPGTSMVVYAVRTGDTLLKIARSYGVKTGTITGANRLDEDAVLQTGSKLLIPLMFEDHE